MKVSMCLRHVACLMALGLGAAQAQTGGSSTSSLAPNSVAWASGAYLLVGDIRGEPPASLATTEPIVNIHFTVVDMASKQPLARFAGATRVQATSDSTLLLVIPQPPGNVNPAIGVELQGVTVRLDLQNGRTFQAVQTCKVDAMRQLVRPCTRAIGVVVDKAAEQLILAGRESSRQRSADVESMRNSISRNLQNQHETQMNIIRNMVPCRPGEYCAR